MSRNVFGWMLSHPHPALHSRHDLITWRGFRCWSDCRHRWQFICPAVISVCVCVWMQSHSHLLWEGSQEKQPNLVSYLVRHLLCFFKFGWNTTFPSCTFIFCHLIHLYRQHENSLIIIQFKMISGFTEKKNTICILTYKTFFLLVVVVVTTCILLTATCGKVTGRNRL